MLILISAGLGPLEAFLAITFMLPALLVSFTIHEFCHAWAALGEGDDTARSMGRLSFNPIKHIDPLGFALILIIGIGYAKPVRVNSFNLRHGQLGMSWVAAAGPLSNFVIAFLVGLLFRFDVLSLNIFDRPTIDLGNILVVSLFLIIHVNLILGLFNLIPIPPLDGSKVLGGLLPRSLYYSDGYMRFEQYALFALIAFVMVNLVLIFIPFWDIYLLGSVLTPPVSFLFELLTGQPWPLSD